MINGLFDLAATRRSVLAGIAASITLGSQNGYAQVGFGTNSRVSAYPWTIFGFSNTNTRAATSYELNEELDSPWSRSIDDPRTNRSLSTNISSPIRYHRLLIYTTNKGIIVRGSADGSLIWRQNSPDHCNANAVPTVTEDTVITGDGRVAAWDIGTGDIQWEVDIPGAVSGPIQKSGPEIYAPTSGGLSGGVVEINRNKSKINRRMSMDANVSNAPAINDQGVYVLDDGGLLRHFSDGEIVWEQNIPNSQYTEDDIDDFDFQAPILIDNEVVIPVTESPSEGSPYGAIYRFDVDTGSFYDDISGFTSADFNATVYNNNIIVAGTSGTVASVNYDGYGTDWESSIGEEIKAAPVVVDDTIIVGGISGTLFGLDAGNGEAKWEYQVLDERISGIIGGQNSIYVSGWYNSIGGIHNEQSLSARREFQEVLSQLHTGLTYGIDTSGVSSSLIRASDNLAERDYDEAITAIEAAKEAIGTEVSKIQETKNRIRSVRQTTVNIGNKTNYNPSTIKNKINRSEQALQSRDLETAHSLAIQAESQINEVASEYNNSKIEINELNATITTGKEKNISVQKASIALKKAQTLFQNGSFQKAINTANTTRIDLDTRIERIENFRNKENEMTEYIKLAKDDGINISRANEIYADAETNYKQGNYSNANEKIEIAVNKAKTTIETANKTSELISQAENFTPIQPFVKDLARNMGSQKHLSKAHSSFQNGQYNEALASAKRSRSAQRNARLIVLGSGISAVGSYGIYRYKNES